MKNRKLVKRRNNVQFHKRKDERLYNVSNSKRND